MTSLDADRLYFHSRSASKPLPGNGANEQVDDHAAYAVLQRTPDWRKMLSNFYPARITSDAGVFNNVEAYFQSEKFRLAGHVDFAKTFMQGSGYPHGDTLGGEAAQKQRKGRLLNDKQIEEWSLRSGAVMQEGQKCKFTQHKHLEEVLLGTGKAQLWHGASRQRPKRMLSLENVRDYVRTHTTQSSS